MAFTIKFELGEIIYGSRGYTGDGRKKKRLLCGLCLIGNDNVHVGL